MKKIAILCITLTLLACNNAENKKDIITEEVTTEVEEILNDKMIDDPEEEGSKMLIGRVEVADLTSDEFPWFMKEVDAYTMDDDSMVKLEAALKDKDITVFMGTWCEDSQREVPRLVKILVTINHENGPVIVAVNREKEIPVGITPIDNIEYVPTIIISENGKELGRIVESTQESLEKDLIAIATGQDYKHIYEE